MFLSWRFRSNWNLDRGNYSQERRCRFRLVGLFDFVGGSPIGLFCDCRIHDEIKLRNGVPFRKKYVDEKSMVAMVTVLVTISFVQTEAVIKMSTLKKID